MPGNTMTAAEAAAQFDNVTGFAGANTAGYNAGGDYSLGGGGYGGYPSAVPTANPITGVNNNNYFSGGGYAYTDKYGISHVAPDYQTAQQYSGDGNIQGYTGAFAGGYAIDAKGNPMALPGASYNSPNLMPYDSTYGGLVPLPQLLNMAAKKPPLVPMNNEPKLPDPKFESLYSNKPPAYESPAVDYRNAASARQSGYSITANPADTQLIPTARAIDRQLEAERMVAEQTYKDYSAKLGAWEAEKNLMLSLLPYQQLTAYEQAQVNQSRAAAELQAELAKAAREEKSRQEAIDNQKWQAEYDLKKLQTEYDINKPYYAPSSGGSGSGGTYPYRLYDDLIAIWKVTGKAPAGLELLGVRPGTPYTGIENTGPSGRPISDETLAFQRHLMLFNKGGNARRYLQRFSEQGVDAAYLADWGKKYFGDAWFDPPTVTFDERGRATAIKK